MFSWWSCFEPQCCKRKLLRSNIFKDIWIQPAAGDAGGALGAAQSVWYQYLNNSRTPDSPDSMRGSYLGSIFDDEEIKEVLDSYDAKMKLFKMITMKIR